MNFLCRKKGGKIGKIVQERYIKENTRRKIIKRWPSHLKKTSGDLF